MMEIEQRIVRSRKSLKITSNTKRNRVMNPTFHVLYKPLIIIQAQNFVNRFWADGSAIHHSQISFVISEPSRQTVRLLLHIVITRLDIIKRAINHTSPRLPYSDLPTGV